MPRCLACCRMVRAVHGDYGLCRKCNRHLEDDIGKWMSSVSRDLDRLVAFDAYCADRDAGTAGNR